MELYYRDLHTTYWQVLHLKSLYLQWEICVWSQKLFEVTLFYGTHDTFLTHGFEYWLISSKNLAFELQCKHVNLEVLAERNRIWIGNGSSSSASFALCKLEVLLFITALSNSSKIFKMKTFLKIVEKFLQCNIRAVPKIRMPDVILLDIASNRLFG